MRSFAITLTIAALLAGSAQAADIGNSVKTYTNPKASFDKLNSPSEVPSVADLVNATRIDGTQDDPLANSNDGFYVGTESQGNGTYSLQVQKKLLDF
ncbi:MAG: hypothetical protein ACOH12_08890 [Parvibaculaceae bacterium]